MTVPDQVMCRAIMPVVLFILAMAARWTHGRFLTVDEAYHWISLSRRFANAVASGNFADTFYFGHPAVTTLWLGALGHKIYEALTVLEILAEHPATFYAIMHVWVYQVSPPVTAMPEADFGDMVRLRGYDLDTSAARASGVLTVTLVWEALARPDPSSLFMFIHVMNDAGERVAQVDVPLGTERWPLHAWQPGRYVSMVQHIPLPLDLPAGTYRLATGVYDPQTLTRLRLRTDGERADDAGQDALLLTRLTIP